MSDYHVTIDGETVHGLFQGDAGLAKLLEQVLNQVLEAQVSEQLGAERYERTEERQGYRNGVRPRQLTTRVGRLTLRVPQVRDGQFSPELFARYQRSEQALVLALMEMVVNGVSTRKVTAITEELCGTSFSKSTVSALCARLDPLVAAWNERPLRSWSRCASRSACAPSPHSSPLASTQQGIARFWAFSWATASRRAAGAPSSRGLSAVAWPASTWWSPMRTPASSRPCSAIFRAAVGNAVRPI
jgi:Transposase, Mutator family